MPDNPFAKYAPTPSGNPFAKYVSGTPAATEPRREEYTGTILPIRRDANGEIHFAVPEILASPFRGMEELGRRAFGSEADALRPETPNEMSAATMGALPFGARLPLDAGNAAAHALLKDFESHGVTPSVPSIGQGRVAGLAANTAKSLPISSQTIRRGIVKALNETADAATRMAGRFGRASDSEGAGSAVRNAARRFAADQSQAKRDYREFFDAMAGAPPVPVTHTMNLVNELMGRYPNAPGLTGMFTRSPIARLRSELTPRTETIEAQTSPILGENGEPIVVREAQTVRRGGVLSMPELQELRSQVGYQIQHPGFGPDDIPRAQLRRLYAALTQDMKSAARAQGPKAVKALEQATTNYGIRMRLIDKLEPLIKGERSEGVFTKLNTAALSSGASDAGLLRAAKKVMTPQEWGDFDATIITRLGEPTPGAKDILSPGGFSAASFATNWNKLSNKAKDLLFGEDTPGSPRSGMESLARVAQAQKNVAKLSNVSHSGEFVLIGALGTELVHAAFRALTTGEAGELLGIGAYGATAAGAAKLLMNPRFARWLYELPKIRAKTPQEAVQAGVDLLAAYMATPAPSERGTRQPEKSPTPPAIRTQVLGPLL